RSSGQPEVSLFVDVAQVTGIEPPLVVALGIRHFQPQTLVMNGIKVALEQIRALDDDRSGLPYRGITQIAAGWRNKDNPNVLPGQAQADRTNLALAGYRIEGGGASGLGQTIALEYLHPGFLLETGDQFLGHRRGATYSVAHAGNVAAA